MNKFEIAEATIDVFENGAPLPFVAGTDYLVITPGLINPHWGYPCGLSSINDALLGRIDHPFIHISGGYEENPGARGTAVFPPGCRVFYFNRELCQIMNSLCFPRTFFHNNLIQTLPHTVIGNKNIPFIANTERPDLIEINGAAHQLPSFRGNLIIAASDAGHNFICQTPHGIFDKMCQELWRLSTSGIDDCFFIALYTHKQNLGFPDICANIYRNANNLANICYPAELQTYCNDISQIDPDYIHLLFRGVRPIGQSTYFHVFIVEKPHQLNFFLLQTAGGTKIRPVGYQIISN